MGEQVLTLTEAAELVGKSRRTLERAVASGRLAHEREVVDGRDIVVVQRSSVAELYGVPGDTVATSSTDAPASLELAVQAWREAAERNEDLQQELVAVHERHGEEVHRMAGLLEVQTAEAVSARKWGRWTAVAAALVIAGVTVGAWRTVDTVRAAEMAVRADLVESEVRVEVESERASQARAEALEAAGEVEVLRGQLEAREQRQDEVADFIARRMNDLEAMAAEMQR